MKISVCMAVYNGSRFLKEQLRSILMQLGPADEFIIVDDASSDNSFQIIEKYGGKRVKVCRNDFNLGPIRSFERALGFTTGDFIFFSDQDDVWFKGKIDEMLGAFRKFKPMAVVSDAVVVDEKKKIIAKSYFSMRNSGPGVLKNFYKNTYLGACLAIDSRAKKWILPFPKMILQHDEWIGLTCDFVGKVYFLKKTLVYYRRHPDTVTKGRRFKMWKVIFNRIKYLIAVLGRSLKLLRLRLKFCRE